MSKRKGKQREYEVVLREVKLHSVVLNADSEDEARAGAIKLHGQSKSQELETEETEVFSVDLLPEDKEEEC